MHTEIQIYSGRVDTRDPAGAVAGDLTASVHSVTEAAEIFSKIIDSGRAARMQGAKVRD